MPGYFQHSPSPLYAQVADAMRERIVKGLWPIGTRIPTLPELAAGCDVLVAECTFGPGPPVANVPHLTAGQAGEIAARAGVGRLLLAHCSPEHDRDATLAQARAAFGGPVDWARQGEAVTL